jgi:hypothetical protein
LGATCAISAPDSAYPLNGYIEHITDPFVGQAIAIGSETRTGIELEVKPIAARFGREVEFVADLKNDAYFYILVGLERDDGSTSTGWLRLGLGSGQPQPYFDEIEAGYAGEWQLSIEPICSKGDDWLLFRVDVEEIVTRTFGGDGWRFRELKKVRVRDNLSLDYISVFGIEPESE